MSAMCDQFGENALNNDSSVNSSEENREDSLLQPGNDGKENLDPQDYHDLITSK